MKIYSKLSNGNEISPDLSLIVTNKIHELRKAFELIYKLTLSYKVLNYVYNPLPEN